MVAMAKNKQSQRRFCQVVFHCKRMEGLDRPINSFNSFIAVHIKNDLKELYFRLPLSAFVIF